MCQDQGHKSDLNLFTETAVRVTSMKVDDLLVNEVSAQQIRPVQRTAASIRSHKAIVNISSPFPSKPLTMPGNIETQYMITKAHSGRKKSDTLRKLDIAAARTPCRTTRTYTIPDHHGQVLGTDKFKSASPTATPAIIVTPADEKPWTLNSAESPTRGPVLGHTKELGDDNYDPASRRSITELTPLSAESDRPKSQGWWNLMLSPILRNNSIVSKREQTQLHRTPVPAIPISDGRRDSLSLPVSSDPLCIRLSKCDTSPVTPRRCGLASGRVSTWSRWMDWEEQRNVSLTNTDTEDEEGAEMEVASPLDRESFIATRNVATDKGLAEEYFHACAVEAVTARPYFECVGHSCADRLPKLASSTLSRPLVTQVPGATAAYTPPKTSIVEVIAPEDFPSLKPDQVRAETSATVEDVNFSKKDSPNGDNDTAGSIARVVDASRHLASTDEETRAQFTITVAVATDIARARVDGDAVSSGDTPDTLISAQSQNKVAAKQVNKQRAQAVLVLESAAVPSANDTSDIDRDLESGNEKSVNEDKPTFSCFSRSDARRSVKRRWLYSILILLIAILVACVVLAVRLTRTGDQTPINAQWLNLTGYPPIPTGISTIASPNLSSSQNRCTTPSTLWSCFPPADVSSGHGILINGTSPDFRFEVRFRNGTVTTNLTIPLDGNIDQHADRDPFTNDLYSPSPDPPNTADQIFLGRTTDNVTNPLNGEMTPFYITLLPVSPVLPPLYNHSTSPVRLIRRSSSNSTFLVNTIPPPSIALDGSAAPSSLLPTLPYPSSQPLRLYNHGLQDEHYGFYIYYDKSVFLSGFQISNNTLIMATDSKDVKANDPSTKSTASVRCTFSQTRFLVKMFTNAAFNGALLSNNDNDNHNNNSNNNTALHYLNNHGSSATDFVRPGSFPYPTTITIDRHGGDIASKGTFCYGVQNETILKDDKAWIDEDRPFGGQLINEAPRPYHTAVGGFNRTAGGIDGGTGGCHCQWQNWA